MQSKIILLLLLLLLLFIQTIVTIYQAGIIEEMMEDTFEGMEEDDMEEAAQEEVDKILFEVTKGNEQPKI